MRASLQVLKELFSSLSFLVLPHEKEVVGASYCFLGRETERERERERTKEREKENEPTRQAKKPKGTW